MYLACSCMPVLTIHVCYKDLFQLYPDNFQNNIFCCPINTCACSILSVYSRTSIIRLGNVQIIIRKWAWLLYSHYSCNVTMETCMLHCCLSIKWVDQGVAYPSDYPVIRPAYGTNNQGSTRVRSFVEVPQKTLC